MIIVHRLEDGLFHCPCGDFSDQNPDQLRTHVRSACRSNTDTILGELLAQQTQNDDFDHRETNSPNENDDLGDSGPPSLNGASHDEARYTLDEDTASRRVWDDGHILDPDDAYMRFSGHESHSYEKTVDDGNGKWFLVVLVSP